MAEILTQTERLILRRASLSDTELIFELLNQKSFIENVADKQIRTLDDAKKYIESAFFTPYDLAAPSPILLRCLTGPPLGFVGSISDLILLFPTWVMHFWTGIVAKVMRLKQLRLYLRLFAIAVNITH